MCIEKDLLLRKLRSWALRSLLFIDLTSQNFFLRPHKRRWKKTDVVQRKNGAASASVNEPKLYLFARSEIRETRREWLTEEFFSRGISFFLFALHLQIMHARVGIYCFWYISGNANNAVPTREPMNYWELWKFLSCSSSFGHDHKSVDRASFTKCYWLLGNS